MNEFVLIDSSCWIKFFRNSDKIIADTVTHLIKSDQACLCGIIELELFQGIKSVQQLKNIQDVFSILTYYHFQREDYIKAGNTIRNLRLNGISVSLSDSLIAELCQRNNLRIFTTDTDFKYFNDLKIYQ